MLTRMAAPEREQRFVERFAGVLAASGAPPMAGRVWARILASEAGAMTSAELSEALQASQPAVSGAVRFLVQIGFVSRERIPGTRKERYRVSDGIWEILLIRRNDSLEAWRDAADYGVQTYGADSAVGRRLAEAVEFFDFLRCGIGELLEQWQERQAAAGDR